VKEESTEKPYEITVLHICEFKARRRSNRPIGINSSSQLDLVEEVDPADCIITPQRVAAV
jgi:hypothetical protein